jgi:hypothetical protein
MSKDIEQYTLSYILFSGVIYNCKVKMLSPYNELVQPFHLQALSIGL